MKERKFTENFGDKTRLGARQMWCRDLHINLGGLACVCGGGGGGASGELGCAEHFKAIRPSRPQTD